MYLAAVYLYQWLDCQTPVILHSILFHLKCASISRLFMPDLSCRNKTNILWQYSCKILVYCIHWISSNIFYVLPLNPQMFECQQYCVIIHFTFSRSNTIPAAGICLIIFDILVSNKNRCISMIAIASE